MLLGRVEIRVGRPRKRSWDNPDRRPSHADRRRWISRKMLQKQFLAALPNTPDRRKFRNLIASLLSLRIIDPYALRLDDNRLKCSYP